MPEIDIVRRLNELDARLARLESAGAPYSTNAAGDVSLSASIRASTALWARAYNSGATTVNNATWTLVSFDSERWDTDGIHNTAGSTSRLTAATAGVYGIWFNGNFASNATGFRGVQFRLNADGNSGSGTAIAANSRAAVNGDRTGVQLHSVYSLAAGDRVEVFVYQNSGASLSLDSIANLSPEFSMIRIA